MIYDTNSESKKLTGIHPAIHSVITNDDLLMEILVRLPIIPLLKFKRVSKKWLNLITEPNFTLRRSQVPRTDPPTGLFVKRSDFGYDLFPFKSSRVLHVLHFDILQSCNVLLLCSTSQKKDKRIFVLNPVARWSVSCGGCEYGSNRIAFDPSKSWSYKFFRAMKNDEFNITSVDVYSSETREWTNCPDVYPAKWFVGFRFGVYWSDAIYWVNFQFGELPTHFKFSYVDEHPVLTQVRLPWLNSKLHSDIKLFATGGSLFLICWDYEHENLLGIYEMTNGCSDWLFKYFVDLNDVLRTFGNPYWRIRRNVMSIVLGEKEEDTFMVIEMAGLIVEYKFKFKTFRPRCEMGSHCPRSCFEFIASFAPLSVSGPCRIEGTL